MALDTFGRIEIMGHQTFVGKRATIRYAKGRGRVDPERGVRLMPLLNYTTTISAGKTLGEIQAVLAAHGATSISIDYADSVPAALTFTLPTAHGPRSFRLPANLSGVLATLKRQYTKRQIAARYVTTEHAARVGWRILKDWVEAQVAIIEAGMVQADEVFLPYLLVEAGRTVYDEYKEHETILLGTGRE